MLMSLRQQDAETRSGAPFALRLFKQRWYLLLGKTDIDQANYLKNLPLHESQKIIEETNDYVIFSWRLKPTYDFIQQVLTMNVHAEVLQPESFRNEIKSLITNMLGKYK